MRFAVATMNRRTLLHTTAAALAASASTAVFAREKVATKILLRSSWQTVNIGDIAHTPGMLALLEKHCRDAEVTLWPSKVDRGVEEILRARFRASKNLVTRTHRGSFPSFAQRLSAVPDGRCVRRTDHQDSVPAP